MVSQKAKSHRAAYIACTITLVTLAAALLAGMPPLVLAIVAGLGVAATLLCVVRARHAPAPAVPPPAAPTEQGNTNA